jgi:hypothetical protein
MSREDSIRTITLKLTEAQHRLLCDVVHGASSANRHVQEDYRRLYEDIVVNGPAFHTTPELCTHPIEFQRREDRRWPTLDRNSDDFYARYVCNVCGSKRTDVENGDGGTLQEGEWAEG